MPRQHLCIYPACKNEIASRGLCNMHYAAANRLVKKGLTTWEKLQRHGKAIKSTRNTTLAMKHAQWFLAPVPRHRRTKPSADD